MQITENYVITQFNPVTAPEAELEKYINFSQKRLRDLNPEEPLPQREMLKKSLLEKDPTGNYRIWVAYDKLNPEFLVGYATLYTQNESSPGYEENKDYGFFNTYVTKEYRKLKIGTGLLQTVFKEGKNSNKKALTTYTTEFSGKKFAEKFNGSKALESSEYNLTIKEVDWDLVERWRKEGVSMNGDKKVIAFIDVPEKYLNNFCKFYTESWNEIPMGDIETVTRITPKLRRRNEQYFRSIGKIRTTFAITNDVGDICAITELIYNPKKQSIIDNVITAVSPNYRKMKLAKWIKAESLFFIKSKYPQVRTVMTMMADSNKPMLYINKKLGFKKVKEGQYYNFDISISLEPISHILTKNTSLSSTVMKITQ